MGDSAMAALAIFLAAILMFVFPLMTMADKKDDITTVTVQTATTEFVDGIRVAGEITKDDYDKYIQKLASTGNSYQVDLELQVSDINPQKKEATVEIGDNVYYVMYTKQILEAIENGSLSLKEGDIISATAKNTNVTIGMQLRNFMYNIIGKDGSNITASASGLVTVNGK